MHTYRSKCRWNMLLHIDGEIIEIRPGELFESKHPVDSRHLEEIIKRKTVKKTVKKVVKPSITFEEEFNGGSGTES
mgnify:FL=1